MTLVALPTPADNADPLTFIDGVKTAVPVVVAYVPIAFSFGIVATAAGFSPAEAVLMSLIIYSGAAQFLAVALFSGGAPILVSVLTLAAMNLRHALYGPALMKAGGGSANNRFVWLWGFGLTDEVFGAAMGRIGGERRPLSEHYMAGIGLAAYLAWSGGTAVGAWAGGSALQAYPVIHNALNFMYPAMFLSFLLSILARKQAGTVAVAGLATLAGTMLVSPATGILCGMIAGALWGALGPIGKEREPSS